MKINEVLLKIEKDIMYTLMDSNEPLTQLELHLKSELRNTSSYGWSFALDNLERKGHIRFTDNYNRWEITPKGMLIFCSKDSEYV